MDRRDFLKNAGRCAVLAALAGGGALLLKRSVKAGAPQIDTDACKTCGGCATYCVRKPSAVKAVNRYGQCSYCTFCYGHVQDDMKTKVCPVDAIQRRRISEFEFEYTVDEAKCIGCGKCVARCQSHGAKSLVLQVRGRLCEKCNRCTIVANCPYKAIRETETPA